MKVVTLEFLNRKVMEGNINPNLLPEPLVKKMNDWKKDNSVRFLPKSLREKLPSHHDPTTQ